MGITKITKNKQAGPGAAIRLAHLVEVHIRNTENHPKEQEFGGQTVELRSTLAYYEDYNQQRLPLKKQGQTKLHLRSLYQTLDRSQWRRCQMISALSKGWPDTRRPTKPEPKREEISERSEVRAGAGVPSLAMLMQERAFDWPYCRKYLRSK